MTSRFATLLITAACALALAAPATAHEPTNGTAKLYADSVVLDYRFGGDYATWVESTVRTALETDYDNRAYNNSRMPTFAYSTAGSGTVVYSGSSVSPCGTGNSQWIQCALGGGTDTWRIYVRDFARAPLGSAAWFNAWGYCPSGRTCWDMRRALEHEILHITMSANHDAQGEANTVMASETPHDPETGWNTHHIQRCDEAAAQLLYDLASTAGVYANCYDHVPGSADGKLDSLVTTQYSSYSVCVGQPLNIYGRASIRPVADYQRLSNNPLTGRTVRFDRKPHSGTTWTDNVGSTTASSAAGNNWVEDFTAGAPGSWDFRAHYDGETGVDNDISAVFTVTWRSC